MTEVFSVVLPLTAAGILLFSAISKWRHPDDLIGWTEFGVPHPFRKGWLLRLHPWGEAALALLIALTGGVLGLFAALVCVALMAAYLWLVLRAYHRSREAVCACFGVRKRITPITIVRNSWLTLVACGTAAVIWMNPVLGGAAAAASNAQWLVGALTAVITTALVLWPDSRISDEVETSRSTPEANERLDYIRTRTPAVPVTSADGTTVDLRRLAAQKPLLLLAVSEHCGACTPVIESASRYRELLSQVDVRLLIQAPPEHSALTDTTEPQSLHDPYGYITRSIANWPTPAAVLFGTDGMLAGGPEIGEDAIDAFVDDVYESLHGVRPTSASASQ